MMSRVERTSQPTHDSRHRRFRIAVVGVSVVVAVVGSVLPVDQTVLRGSELWALETRPGTLRRVDSRTLEPASAPLRLSAGRTMALASGGGYLWVTAADAGELLRIDPATHAIKRVHVGGFPIGIVVTGGSGWFADHEGGTVGPLEPRSPLP